MVNPYFWPTVTGSGTVTRQLSHELTDRGHTVSILTIDHDGRAREDHIDGVAVYRLPSTSVRLGKLAFHYSLPFTTRRGVQRNIDRIIEMVDPDVVHLHGQFWDLCYWAGTSARSRGIPVVMTVHTVVTNDNSFYDKLARAGDRLMVRPLARRLTDVWTGYDRRVTDYIRFRYGIDDPIFVPNPVESSMFTGKGDGYRVRNQIGLGNEPIILSLGHVIPLRSRVPLVRALPAILEHVPDARVVVVGEVFDREFLHVAERLNVRDRVVPVGRVPHDDVPDWLAAATVEAHVLHGDQGLGLDVSALESMSFGVPTVLAVSSDALPGTDLRNYPGLALLGSSTHGDLARTVVDLIVDPASREQAIVAGRALCADVFSGDVVVDRYLEIYRSAAPIVESSGASESQLVPEA
jgi:glycosyltransferase involved in cell wall biosynthesis